MNKTLLLLLVLLLNGLPALGQTNATDFTAVDCSSVSHTLFSELDAGKVVVLVWVMPCGTCISDAKASYDASQSFASSNPGKILYWMSDDNGNNSCASVAGWASANSIGSTGLTIFDNAGNTISEANYGGTGMPHVVVMGGPAHKIFYNQRNGSNDGAAITGAITSALAATKVDQAANIDAGMEIFPNPAESEVFVRYNLKNSANVCLEVYDIVGKKIETKLLGTQFSGPHAIELNFDHLLANGTYFLKLSADNASLSKKFTIAH